MAGAPNQPRRTRGRPRVSAEEKKRHNMTFRVRSDLRTAIEKMAEANGRSLSEQIEFYVERSIEEELSHKLPTTLTGRSDNSPDAKVGNLAHRLVCAECNRRVFQYGEPNQAQHDIGFSSLPNIDAVALHTLIIGIARESAVEAAKLAISELKSNTNEICADNKSKPA